MYFLYIIRSEKDDRLYVGISRDVQKRLKYHNQGRVNSTKNRRPFYLIHTESFANRLLAREREKYLKSYKGSSEKGRIVDGK